MVASCSSSSCWVPQDFLFRGEGHIEAFWAPEKHGELRREAVWYPFRKHTYNMFGFESCESCALIFSCINEVTAPDQKFVYCGFTSLDHMLLLCNTIYIYHDDAGVTIYEEMALMTQEKRRLTCAALQEILRKSHDVFSCNDYFKISGSEIHRKYYVNMR